MNRLVAIPLALICGPSIAFAATLAQSLGLPGLGRTDPWVWVLGGFGAAVVYVKNPPTTKSNALINSLISVVVGGIIAPPIAAYCGTHYDPTLSSPYPFAFVLSSLWPWVLPFVMKRIQLLLLGREREAERVRFEQSKLPIELVEIVHHHEHHHHHDNLDGDPDQDPGPAAHHKEAS